MQQCPNKIKTRAYIQNLRQRSLQRDVFDISEKFQYQVYNIKQEILGQKIEVKELIKIYFPEKLKMFNISNMLAEEKIVTFYLV